MSFDPKLFRAQFPILERKIRGKPLVYFDNAASAQKPQLLIDAISEAARLSYANIHRGLHQLANEATQAYERSRQLVAQFLNAGHEEEIVFTSNATDGINLVAYGLRHRLQAGDQILLSTAEHHSNIVPWHFLREALGVELIFIGLNDRLELDMDAYEKAFASARVKMVAITHMSNVLGFVTDAKGLCEIAHQHDALILLDGCQAAVHQQIDVQAFDPDFYVFAPHKLYGPTGVGVLYGRKALLEDWPPFRGGGEMIEEVSVEKITYGAPPYRFEAGTPPILEAIALGHVVDWLMGHDRTGMEMHVEQLRRYALDKLRQFNWLRLYEPKNCAGGILSFSAQGLHPHDIAQILDQHGVAIRAGHHCAQPLMQALNVNATARASLAPYNNKDEIDIFVDALASAHRLLG